MSLRMDHDLEMGTSYRSSIGIPTSRQQKQNKHSQLCGWDYRNYNRILWWSSTGKKNRQLLWDATESRCMYDRYLERTVCRIVHPSDIRGTNHYNYTNWIPPATNYLSWRGLPLQELWKAGSHSNTIPSPNDWKTQVEGLYKRPAK